MLLRQVAVSVVDTTIRTLKFNLIFHFMGVNLKIKDSYKSHVVFVDWLIYVGIPSRCAYTRRGDFSTTVVRDFN